MHAVIEKVYHAWGGAPWPFARQLILIGGMAMDYYGMRKAAA